MRLDLPALTWPRTVIVTRPTAGASPSAAGLDRKSTRLNSSHSQISYAVFCLKKKKYNHADRPNFHIREQNVDKHDAPPQNPATIPETLQSAPGPYARDADIATVHTPQSYAKY